MEKPRYISPVVLVLAIVAGGIFLLVRSGFFDGVFDTSILASIKADDMLDAGSIASTVTGDVDGGHTASIR